MYGLWLFKELKTEYGYCKIEIFKKSYSSSPIEIEAVEANSLTLSIENLSETISPIGKSVCSFSIVDTGQLSYDDFFTPDATGIKVVISTINEDRGDVAYTTRWSGFVTPDFYSESLVYRTAINISARDNIGYLSDVEFDLAEPSIQIRELFSKAFTKISEQYPMDVMFRSHKTTEDGVLLTDAVISTALFKDKTWGEVLELILHDMGLQMRWVDNNTIAVIDLSQIPEYYLPTQFQFINSSGYREILPAWRGLAQKQEFGIRENSFDGNILPQNLNFVEEIEIEPPYPSTLYGRQIKYSIPTNWQTTGDIFTANPNDYGEPFGKRIYFTSAFENYRYMSWRQPITASNSPMRITFKALNTLMIPANKLDSETGKHIGKYLREYIPATGKISSYWDGDVLQIGIKYNIILHAGLKSYIFKRDWIEIKEDTDLTPNQFILPEIKYTGENLREDPEQPKEEELNIGIVTIPYTGELEFVLYGWEEIERRTYWEETFGEKYSWDKFFAYIADVTYTFDGENKATGQEAKTSINPLHNILRNENYQLGNVPKYGGGLGAYAGGLFNLVGEELSTFKRNEDSPAYNLLELVGREIIHFNKKNYNKLSGEIKSPTKEPLKFNSLFSREGKLYYPFSCSLNVIDNTMTITSMQEVEPYTTESFTEIHSEVKSDGGTTVSGGNNTVLQYSEEAGNAKRLYEMQDATPAEKEKAFALVDSPDFPQARRIRVADLIGLDEQALAQYLELNKYLQENDLTPITNRIGVVEGYFTNGSAKDALKLGGIVAENYWHKGNSGTLDYDWKAKKLNVRTLVIPTSEPTDLLQGEVGFYLGTAGQGAEEPNGSGGLDLTELWAELGSEDYAKKIHISHIPTIQYSSIAGRPSALVNPYALTINGVRYDGSEAITLDISAGGGVADAVAWGNVFNKPTTISGYGITDAYTKDSVDLKLSNYLPKSGGTITGNYNALSIKRNNAYASLIQFENTDGVMGYLGFNSANVPVAYNRTAETMYTLIHSGNISSYNAGSATKLQTTRTIWGQSFDGTGDVSGAIAGAYSITPAINVSYNLGSSTLQWYKVYTRFVDTASGADFAISTAGVEKMRITAGGNILIGITEDIGYKLIVNGTARIAENVIIGASNQYNGRLKIVGVSGENVLFVANNNGASLFTVHNNGNVFIGNPTDNGYKLQVNGTFKANGLIIPTSAPTDLKAGDHALYLGSVGEGAELPNGAGGLDVAELWAELAKADESKQINVSHIPTIEIARVSGLQTILNNKADASALSSYLLKSGGTMSGDIYLPKELFIRSEGYAIFGINKDNKVLVGLPTYSLALRSYGTPTINDNIIYHAGNFNPADYLAKSGGIITSSSVIPLIVNTTHSQEVGIRLAMSEVSKGFVGYNTSESYGVYLYNTATGYRLGIRDNGDLYYYNDRTNILIHSGNYSNYALPLSGGVVKGISPYHQYIVEIDTDNEFYSIYGIKNKGIRKGGLLWSKDSKHLIGVSIFNVTTGDYLGLSDAGSPMYNSNTLIHSGNIGSQSVNYATTAGSAKASDVYAWAKASVKPTYTFSEITSKPTTLAGYGITDFVRSNVSDSINNYTKQAGIYRFSSYANSATPDKAGYGTSLTLYAGADTWSQIYASYAMSQNDAGLYWRGATTSNNDIAWRRVLDSANYTSYTYSQTTIDSKLSGYLLLSGGTLKGGLTISEGNFIVKTGDTVLGYCYPTADNTYALGQGGRRWSDVRTVLINGGTPIHSGNIGSQSVASATKLADNTAYTAWGQTFFENGKPKNVDGNLTLYKNSSNNAEGWTRGIVVRNSSDTILCRFGFLGAGETLTYAFIGNTYSSPYISFMPNGNVLIGSTVDNGYKLEVNGTLKAGASTLANLRVSGNSEMSGNLEIGTTDSCYIALKRNSLNYFHAMNTSGYIGFITNAKSSSRANCDLLIQDKLVCAGTTEYTDLGSTTYRWKGINAKTLNLSSNAKISGEMDANALVIPTAPPTNPQPGKHYLYLA